MVNRVKKNPELAALLRNHKDKIVEIWAKDVCDLPDSHYQKYPMEMINLWASEGLSAIIDTFSLGLSEKLDKYLYEIAQTRLDANFPIYEFTEGLLMWKEAIQLIIWNSYPVGSPVAVESITQLDTCLRYIVSRFGQLFSEAMLCWLLNSSTDFRVDSRLVFTSRPSNSCVCKRIRDRNVKSGAQKNAKSGHSQESSKHRQAINNELVAFCYDSVAC